MRALKKPANVRFWHSNTHKQECVFEICFKCSFYLFACPKFRRIHYAVIFCIILNFLPHAISTSGNENPQLPSLISVILSVFQQPSSHLNRFWLIENSTLKTIYCIFHFACYGNGEVRGFMFEKLNKNYQN